MDGARRFRTQFGGYNKDDVNDYIKETDLKYASALEAAEAERESLKKEAEEAREKADAYDALKAEFDALTANAESLAATLARLRTEKEEAEGRISELESRAAQSDEEIRTANADLESLRAELEAAKSGGEALRAELDEAGKAAAEKDGRIAGLEEEAERLKTEAADAASLRAKLSDREKEIAELKAYVLREIDSLKASKEKEIGEFRARKEQEFEKKLSELEARKEREKNRKAAEEQAEEPQRETEVPGQICMELEPKQEMSEQTKMMRFMAGNYDAIRKNQAELFAYCTDICLKMDKLNDTLHMILRAVRKE